MCNATHENLLLAISQLERIDLFVYGRREKNENGSKVHPAGAIRPEGPRVCRKEWGKREYGPRERSNFWAIAGQFRRVPNPPLFGGDPRPPPLGDHPPRARPPKPMLRGIARFCIPSFGVASFCTRVESHSFALTFALSLRHARPSYQPPGRVGGFVYAQPAKNRQRDDCGLRPRKTIAVGRRNSDFEFIKE